MATFTFQGQAVYYEVAGQGRPLVLLNGIMMSTRSWQPFLSAFQAGGNQLLLVDLLDQGQSAPMPDDFPITRQADMLAALMDHLNMPEAALFGTSYGGEVALNFAAAYPHRVSRMVLANTVARTNAWLREIGDAWNLAADNPEGYYATTIPVIYSPAFYDRKAAWMARRKQALVNGPFSNPGFMARMQRLTRSAESHDVRSRLSAVTCPVLLISSEMDHITPPEEQRLLQQLLPQAELVLLPQTGHAAFYERPDLFVSIMMGFINHREAIQLPG